jgi:hypothetical protein
LLESRDVTQFEGSPSEVRDDDRTSLEAARDEFVRRLHRCSDDFDATRGLSAVLVAIGRLAERPPVITSST